jgi:two-component system, LytTR family, response regulator
MNTVRLPIETNRVPLQAVTPMKSRILDRKFSKIALPTLEGIIIENIDDIIYLEADGNYTKIHFNNGRNMLVCKTLQSFETILIDCQQFIRIHRSYNINIEKMSRYVRGKGGIAIMENGKELDVSNNKKIILMEAIKTLFRFE